MIRLIIATLFTIFICVSCDECEQEIPVFYKKGNSSASESTKDFTGYAVFRYSKILDAQQNLMCDSSKLAVVFNAIDDCFTRQISLLNVDFMVGDTTFLRNDTLGIDIPNNLPSAKLFRSHGDALLGSYDLIKNSDSWVLIDEVNSDTTKVSGQFNLSFFDPDVNADEQKTILFSNGDFDAEFGDF